MHPVPFCDSWWYADGFSLKGWIQVLRKFSSLPFGLAGLHFSFGRCFLTVVRTVNVIRWPLWYAIPLPFTQFVTYFQYSQQFAHGIPRSTATSSSCYRPASSWLNGNVYLSCGQWGTCTWKLPSDADEFWQRVSALLSFCFLFSFTNKFIDAYRAFII